MEAADAVVVEFSEVVAGLFPLLVDRIPVGPAAQLGRLGAPDDPGLRRTDPRPWRVRAPVASRVGQARAKPIGAARLNSSAAAADGLAGSAAVDVLRGLGPLLAERLLGALEQTVAGLDLTGVPDLSSYLGEPVSGGWFAYGSVGQDSEAVTAAAMLDRLYPDSVDLVVSLTRRLAAHPRIASLLTVVADGADESAIAARHGAAYLAMAVATSAAVLGQVRAAWLNGPAAVVGVALGTAAMLLCEAPMPSAYGAAVLAKVRAEYLLPRQAAGSVPVAGHRFALVEGGFPDTVDFGGNGLVAVVAGGVVIRTAIGEGAVRVLLTVLAEPPEAVEPGWEEVVEVSWRAAEGRASVVGPDGPGDPQLLRQTPPWPGDYRVRVHARGRDDVEDAGAESYQVTVWQAPAAPEIVHRRTDRLGHRLRGEPEPDRSDRPELAYRWVRRSALGDAATVTVVTGATVEEVLYAFGADPARAESMREITDDLDRRGSIGPWVYVLDTGQAVLAVEYNGFQGSHAPVLQVASASGRAASMFWNINAVTRLSFAEGGRLLASFEPPADVGAGPAVATALAGLDFDEPGDKAGKGLVAVERFTGRGITAEDLARIEAAGVAFRIVPHLPVLYPYHPVQLGRLPDLDAAALGRLPEARLRDLAWWAVAEAARYAGLADDGDIAASIAARGLTQGAIWRARRAQLQDGEYPWLWRALHSATNPDPLAAVTDTIDAARYAAGPHAAELIENTRTRLAT